MARNLTATAIGLAATLLLGCGGSGALDDTSAAPANPAGAYSGVTSQGLPIDLSVANGTITQIRFGWRARCADGEVHENVIDIPGRQLRNGVFSVRAKLETGGIARVDGTVDGQGAHGTLSRTRGSAFGTNCTATGITWLARSKANNGNLPPAPAPAPDAPAEI